MPNRNPQPARLTVTHCNVCHKEILEGEIHNRCRGRRATPCMEECQESRARATEILERYYSLPPLAFEAGFAPFDWGEDAVKEQEPTPKLTLEKELEILKENLKNEKVDTEIIERLIMPYMNSMKMQVCADLLEKSRHLRTAHDIRCFIENYMFEHR